jgi:hypothetical protein
VIADRREAGPYPHGCRIATRLLGSALDGTDAARGRLVGEERVQDDGIAGAPAERKRVRAERGRNNFSVSPVRPTRSC